MTKPSTSRRGWAHLRLVPEADEWPDDLLPFLEHARSRLLEGPGPAPSPEVLAYLEQPAHGKVDGDGSMLRATDPEPFELEALAPARASRGVHRHLVAAAGAAAALVLVALGLRPVLTSSPTEVGEPVAMSAVATTAPPTTAPATTAPSEAAMIASPDLEVPPTPTAPPPTVPPVDTAPPVTEPAPPVTTAKAAPKPARPRTPPTPAPAPAPAPAASTQDLVLQYFHAANARGRCVAKQPAGSSRAQLVAACGAEPVPPANLVQFWAARNTWQDCAEPLLDRGMNQAKVNQTCGARPDRSAYDVPANPYSASS